MKTDSRGIGKGAAFIALVILFVLRFVSAAILPAAASVGATAKTDEVGTSVKSGGEAFTLTVTDGRTEMINGVFYGVSFDTTSGYGYLTHEVPTVGDVFMEWDCASSALDMGGGSSGRVMGYARSNDKGSDTKMFESPAGTGSFRFSINGGSAGYTVAGEKGELRYSVADSTAYLNDSALPKNAYPAAGGTGDLEITDAAIETKGEGYFGIQWIESVSYALNLSRIQIYDESGRDLGVRLAPGIGDFSIQRYGIAGERVTIRPEPKEGKYAATLQFSDEDGSPVSGIAAEDNYDGTFSFVMPSQKLSVQPIYVDSTAVSVTFDANNGDDAVSVPAKTGERLKKPQTPVKEGFAFAGWYKEGENEVFDFSRNVTSAFTLNAVWLTAVDSAPYTGLYVSGDKSISLFADGSIYSAGIFEDKISFAVGKDDDEVFVCADSYPQLKKLKAEPGDKLVFEGETYVKYEGDPYLIEYVAETSVTESVYRYSTDGKVENIEFSADKFLFEGWTTVSGEPFDFGTKVRSDTTLYAKLSADDGETDYGKYYGNYYDAESGCLIRLKENNVAEISTDDGTENAEYRIFTDGVMWLIQNGEYSFYSASYTSFSSGAAHYRRLFSYVVTFEGNGGETAVKSAEINGGDYRLTLPEDPVREGFAFDGWYYLDGREFDPDTVVTESITLYAKWTPNAATKPTSGCGAAAGFGGFTAALTVCILSVGLLVARNLKKRRGSDDNR